MEIYVKVLAGAKSNRVMQQSKDHFTVRTTAPAMDGKANQAVINQLSQYLGIKKSQLILHRGAKNKEKVFLII